MCPLGLAVKVPFDHVPPCACSVLRCPLGGILWAYWQEELAYGVVVITTHCAAPWCEAAINP